MLVVALLLASLCLAQLPSTDELLALCETDRECAARFGLDLPRADDAFEFEEFSHLLAMFLRDNNLEGAEFPRSGNATTDRWWLLRLLRTAQFCGPSEVYLLGECRCRSSPVSNRCSSSDASRRSWEFSTFIVVAVMILAAVIWTSWQLWDSLSRTRNEYAAFNEAQQQQQAKQQDRLAQRVITVARPE